MGKLNTFIVLAELVVSFGVHPLVKCVPALARSSTLLSCVLHAADRSSAPCSGAVGVASGGNISLSRDSDVSMVLFVGGIVAGASTAALPLMRHI
eukprot:scaffold3449_cov339-Prasinococcus_capsulatus_cf.AAC.4